MTSDNPHELDAADAVHRFHARYPGSSGRVFAPLRLDDGRSSYAWLVDGLRRGPVLDLGCGDGAALALLVERGLPAVGVDTSEAELAVARSRFGDDVELIQADMRALPAAAGRFEAVVSHMAAMLTTDAPAVLRAIDRALAPGGVMRLVVGRQLDEPAPATAAFLDALRDVTSAHGPRIRFDGTRWDAALLRDHLPGWNVEQTDLRAERLVPADQLADFTRVAFYASGLLDDAGWAALTPAIEQIAFEHAVDGQVPWAMGLRGLVARKPF